MKNTKARDNSGDDWKTPDWFYDKLNASQIEFVRGRLHFEQRNDQGKFVSKGAGQHDSMVVVFQGKE